MSCSGGSSREIRTCGDRHGTGLTIRVTAGESWVHKQKMGMLNLSVIPQVVVWTEDKEGRYLDTLFITQAYGKQNWKFVDTDPDETLRTLTFPVWSSRRREAGYPSVTRNSPMPDDVTAATPKTGFTLYTTAGTVPEDFNLFMEINKSFDGNDAFYGQWDGTDDGFTEETINGQPSVVYMAEIRGGETEDVSLEIAGRGGSSETDEPFYNDTSGMTTALNLIAGATVRVGRE
jgi:hypothetical protein